MMLSLLAETATGALGDGCAGIAFMSNFGDCDSYAKTNHAYCVDDVDIIFPKCSAQVACPDECKQVEVVPGSTCATIAFDAGYGSCSTYNVIDGINRPFCALDKDMGHTKCTAAASCDECKNQPAVKKDPSTDSKTCANIVFDAAFGLCDSYAHWPNHGYCQHDTDHYYNCKAADSCKECAPQDKLETDTCTAITFNAGFGNCNTYASKLPNNKFCATDVDRVFACTAAEACKECAKIEVESCATLPGGAAFDAGYGPCSTYALSNKFHCSDVDAVYDCTAKQSCKECAQTGTPTQQPTAETNAPTVAVTNAPTQKPTVATLPPTTAAPTNVRYSRWYMQKSPKSCDASCSEVGAPDMKCDASRMNKVTTGEYLKGAQSAIIADQGLGSAWACKTFGTGKSATVYEPSNLNGQCDPQSVAALSTCDAKDPEYTIHRLCCCVREGEDAAAMCPILYSDCDAGTQMWDESTSRCLPQSTKCPADTVLDADGTIPICRITVVPTPPPTVPPTTPPPTSAPTTPPPTDAPSSAPTQVMCPELVAPVGGNRPTLTNGRYVASAATFTCKDGYTMAGEPVLTCTSEGQGEWDFASPTCTQKPTNKPTMMPTNEFDTTFCTALDAPTNGNAPVYTDSLFHGSMAAFECKFGYTLSFTSPLVCAAGVWSSASPICTDAPTAAPTAAGDDTIGTEPLTDAPTAALTENTIVTDAPRKPETLSPVSPTTDAPTDAPAPVDPKTELCHAQSAPLNGLPPIITQNLLHGSVASFRCQIGYKLVGYKEILCAGGEWSDDAPTCQPQYFSIDGTGVELGDSSTGTLVKNIRCVTDGAGKYGDNEHAKVTILHPGKLVTKGYFGTECNVEDHTESYDMLRINGVKYSCHNAPEHLPVEQGDTMTWSTSLNRHHVGWTLCHEEDDRDRVLATKKTL